MVWEWEWGRAFDGELRCMSKFRMLIAELGLVGLGS